MKRAEYKVAVGKTGFSSLEEEVTRMLNEGWKPVGGLAFNSGYPYQAMARVVTVSVGSKSQPARPGQAEGNANPEKKNLGAQDAMRLIDDLT
ncbi:hypothetical protein ACJJI3_22610 [Microbulbifer sp. ZKSA004]|uniref:hypothetical protein n=1 Tax=unclassified Microbulbifer TaxID=2619833 RepID=UPI0024AD6FAE|nr:hypothetical protein [Microbulbifer sp. VAAF005]WHI48198.1 hypothetical protein P0078_07445 [Microbulbifer sp. VAAF005]